MEITEFSKTVDHDAMHFMIDNAISAPKYSLKRRCSTCMKDRFCANNRASKKVSFLEAIYGNDGVSNSPFFNPITPNCSRFPSQMTPSSFKFSPKNCTSTSAKKFLCCQHYAHKNNLQKKPRIIETILDAPDVINEFPSQLIDISNTNSIIVALGSSVYCWRKGIVTEILQSETLINSVCWMENNAVISAKGNVELWDVNQCKIVRSFQRHNDRVGTISTTCGSRVATGGRDSAIYVTDIRCNSFDPLNNHHGEITSVKFSPEGTFLASCSDSDSRITIWKNNEIKSVLKDSRTQANDENQSYYNLNKITSLAWQSHHVLITGDNSARGAVRYIPIHSNDDEKCFYTNSPISDLSWSKKWGLAISHKGVNAFWEIRNNEFQRNAMINGNMGDIVNIVTSEDNSLVATISVDETLRTYDLKDMSHSSDSSDLSQSELKNIGIR